MSQFAANLLKKQLKELKTHPVEGFAVELKDDSNIMEWNVFILGPPETAYEGGVFKALMTFPNEYPTQPPKLKFLSEFWHPNVYIDGTVCISILHPPVDDPYSGERIEERWTPAQSVETILLSVISLLSDPNVSSPANVDASVECRNKHNVYKERIKKLVEKSKQEIPEGFKMPEVKKPLHQNDFNDDFILQDSEEDDEGEEEMDDFEEEDQ
jgi:ubiquitin-conjugating enzyme E2 R